MTNRTKTTIVFPVKGNKVLLGMKKRGFGAGWWNGFGGKLNKNESYEDCARRETQEEVVIDTKNLLQVAKLLFYFENKFEIASVAFTSSDFSGSPIETEEMLPQWFDIKALPFDSMWPGDEHWIPKALKIKPGDAPIKLAIFFDKSNGFERLGEPDNKIFSKVF